MVHAYVASYPLGSQITPQIDRAQSDPLGLTCEAPHQKISIVHIPLADPTAGTVEKKALSSDSEPYEPDGQPRVEDGVQHGNAPAFIACHDHQAFLARDVMVGSCAGDAQYWSIADRGDPTSADGEPHTHIKREDGTVESFDFIHNAVVTWDGETRRDHRRERRRCRGPLRRPEHEARVHVLLSARRAGAARRRLRGSEGSLLDPAPAELGALRVAQRQRPAHEGRPLPLRAGVLSRAGRRSTTSRTRLRRRSSASPISRTRWARPTRGRRTCTTARSSSTAA